MNNPCFLSLVFMNECMYSVYYADGNDLELFLVFSVRINREISQWPSHHQTDGDACCFSMTHERQKFTQGLIFCLEMYHLEYI